MKTTKLTIQDRINAAYKSLRDMGATLNFQPAKEFGYKGIGLYADLPDGTRWGIDYNKDLDQVRIYRKDINKKFKAVWIEA